MKQNAPESTAFDSEDNSQITEKVSRRKFFGKIGKATAAAAVLGTAPFIDEKSSSIKAQRGGQSSFPALARAKDCYTRRVEAANLNYQETTPSLLRYGNGDEELYWNKIGTYSKGLQHQSNGEVDLTSFNSMMLALRTGNPAHFEQIQIGGTVKLKNPQSGMSFDMEGKDPFSLVQIPAPTFDSKEIGAEIAENYWMAFLRDVPFNEYESNPIAAAAAADLTLFGTDFKGPKDNGGNVTPNLLFRGLTDGDKAGPYLSQFFLKSCKFGANEVNQKIRTVLPANGGGQDYMTDFGSWLAIQNGFQPAGDIFDSTNRYIRNGRDLGQWVHVDVLFQAYFQAFLVISGLGVPVDGNNPYLNSATQYGFGTFGPPHIAALLCEVATRALKAVWNQKWYVHRRLRPEVFAARVHRRLYDGANYPIHSEILNSVNSKGRLGGYLPAGNALLPMAFPEGSPTHPSYGAGHATVAGACVTILKAWFDESFVLQNPVVTDSTGQNLIPYTGDTLTVGGELNKVASNVAIGRNIAGVHWRSDATESLKLGEEVAISILRDQKHCYNESFNGFTLTKFDGTIITV